MPYLRLAHASKILVSVGQSVSIGQDLGVIGKTGAALGDHLHFDVTREQLQNPLSYTFGMSKAQVQQVYMDPVQYMKGGLPAPNLLATGYSFCQWTGRLYHAGTDINSPGDAGKVFKSPVNGTVIYVSPKDKYNEGWGNMLIIKENTTMPTYDIALGKRLAGKFLLAVENHGRLSYVDPFGQLHDVGITPEECAAFLRRIAIRKIPLGITNADLGKIPPA